MSVWHFHCCASLGFWSWAADIYILMYIFFYFNTCMLLDGGCLYWNCVRNFICLATSLTSYPRGIFLIMGCEINIQGEAAEICVREFMRPRVIRVVMCTVQCVYVCAALALCGYCFNFLRSLSCGHDMMCYCKYDCLILPLGNGTLFHLHRQLRQWESWPAFSDRNGWRFQRPVQRNHCAVERGRTSRR